jgi:transposase-like protein
VDTSKESILSEAPPTRPHKNHTEAFKKDAVRRLMARGSKTIEEIAEELGINTSQLYRWKTQFNDDVIGKPQASQKEREELELAAFLVYLGIENYYNLTRLHSYLGYVSPIEFETNADH